MRGFLAGLATLLCAAPTLAQSPQIAALYPAGAQKGQSVEVTIRGGSLAGAKRLLITGAPGVTGSLSQTVAAPDEGVRPLFQAKCTTCHELRSPDNRTLTAEQWAATVRRMITARGADIKADEQQQITGYLQAKARAGVVTARVTVAPEAVSGRRELRLVTDAGVSTAFTFEVGALPEVLATEPNSTPEQAQAVLIPSVVSGVLAQATERDYFAFSAKKGERLRFDLRAFRLSELTAAFFNPILVVTDASGRELARDTGTVDLDPILEWTAPDDGSYRVLVRDLLWKGNPASIYRLVIGPAESEPVAAPATPELALNATPDTVNIGPGSSSAVLVRVTRREGITGPIRLSATALPPGVSATVATIPPDDDKAWMVFTAASDAAPGGAAFSILGEANSGEKTVLRSATPIEMYRGPSNGQRPFGRLSMTVGVTAQPLPFRLESAVTSIALGRDDHAEVTVRVMRQNGFTGGIVVFVPALPNTLYPDPGAIYVPPEKSEAIFQIRSNGDAGSIAKRAASLPPFTFCFTGLVAGINEWATISTGLVAITGKPSP
jgi:hypothetical protein